MSSSPYWQSGPAFQLLCDLVAGDKLVCITGAGISSKLPQKSDPAKYVPQWPGLLENLYNIFEKQLSDLDRQDCRRLLRLDSPAATRESPAGPDLILAASILRSVSPSEFDKRFREAVTNADKSFSDTHSVLLDMQPAGILTFNYDSGHENSALAKGFPLHPMVPSNEAELRDALSKSKRPFYLKAHGSLDSLSELVLTEESYRELLVKSPAYRGFVQNVLTNYDLLFVGFRISDPDFDLFIDSLAHQFGSPIRQHVAVFHEKERTVNDIALRRRYGINVCYIKDFADIPKLLEDALKFPGPNLSKYLAMALSHAPKDRSEAHHYFETLGSAGRLCASNVLREKIPALEATGDHFTLSEVAYSLGTIDARANKPVLMSIVDSARHADPAGRALTVLRPVLVLDDLPKLQSWLDRFSSSPLPGEYSDRIGKYLDYLLSYIPAKFRS